MEKPTFTREQLIPSSIASKQFGELRKKAQRVPQFITDNGEVDTVVLSYDYYEKMYQRLIDLEQKEEARVLTERIERLEKNPSAGIPWRKIKRTVKQDDR